MQAVGVRAGVHREGHHGGAQQVLQGVVQKHTWHIKVNLVYGPIDLVIMLTMCHSVFEHVPGGLVEVHHVVSLDVNLVNGPIDLAIMLTTSVMCHVCF